MTIKTGLASTGIPWAARMDLTGEQEMKLRVPWAAMRVGIVQFFRAYPPPLEAAEEVQEAGNWLEAAGLMTAEGLAHTLAVVLTAAVESLEPAPARLIDDIFRDGRVIDVGLIDGRKLRVHVAEAD